MNLLLFAVKYTPVAPQVAIITVLAPNITSKRQELTDISGNKVNA
jgi:hypothetical protein